MPSCPHERVLEDGQTTSGDLLSAVAWLRTAIEYCNGAFGLPLASEPEGIMSRYLNEHHG